MIELANINNLYDSKFEAFSELLDKIEGNYKMFNDENSLMDYIVFGYVEGKVNLGFNPDFDLPAHIKAEVEIAYKQVFEKI